jgi:hypothetical protein
MRNLSLFLLAGLLLSNVLFASEPSIHLAPNPKSMIEVSFDPMIPETQCAFQFKKVGTGFLVLSVFEDGTINKSLRWLKNPEGKGEGNLHYGDGPYNTSMGTGIHLFPRTYSNFRFEKNGYYYFMCFIKKARDLKKGFKYSNILCVEIHDEKVVSSKLIENKMGLPSKISAAFSKELKEIVEFEGASLKDFSWE